MMFMKFIMHSITKNPLHDGLRNLSGNKLVATSKDFLFKDVKNAARKLGLSINDLITACLSASIGRYFKEKSDELTKEIDICIPANIRFGHYESIEKIKIENKLSFVPLKVPLCNSINESIQEIPKAT